MSNYNFAAHAASDRRKWVVVTISILLIIAVIVTGVLTDWFTNWNKYCVFGHDYGEDGICTRCGKEKLDEVEKAPSDNNQTDEGGDDRKDAAVNGGGMASVLPGNGILLMAAKMAPIDGVPTSVIENTWTLTTTVNEEADDKYINWSVRWKDAQDVWAQDKTVTDYVTVTPTDAGALTATVKVLKDFGSQIEVVATSRDNPEKSAVCLFDYVQKITGLTFNMPDISSLTTSITYEFDTTAYTVEADMKLGITGANLSSEFMNKIVELIDNDFDFDSIETRNVVFFAKSLYVSITSNNIKLQPNTSWYYCDGSFAMSFTESAQYKAFKSHPFNYLLAISTSVSNVDNVLNQLSYYIRQAISAVQTYHFSFNLTYTSTYEGQTYSEGSKVIEGRFDGSSLHIPVTDVTLGQDHIFA